MPAGYEHRIESRVPAGPDVYEFRAADGVLSGEELRTAELLLANAVDPGGESVLVVDANYGVVPVLLAAEAGPAPVVAVERSARAAGLCRDNAARNGADVRVELLAAPADLPAGAVPGHREGAAGDDAPADAGPGAGTDPPVGGDPAPTPDRTRTRGGGAAGFDHVAYAPRPYDPAELVGARLAQSLALARPGGAVTVVAARGGGARRYRDRLEELVGAGFGSGGEAPDGGDGDAGEVERVDRSEGHDVYRVRRPGGAGPGEGGPGSAGGVDASEGDAGTGIGGATPPGPGTVEYRTFAASVGETTVECVSRPGLFSPGGLDRGTELLARSVLGVDDAFRDDGDTSGDDGDASRDGDGADAPSPSPPGPGDRVLDLCCGYGVLGALLAADTGCSVVLTDDDRTATACAERTVRRNGLADRATVVTADAADGVEGPFDAVVSNPPTHAGEGVTRDLFVGAAGVLRPGGTFRLVYNETMAYEESPALRGPFRSVSVLDRTGGYALAVARV